MEYKNIISWIEKEDMDKNLKNKKNKFDEEIEKYLDNDFELVGAVQVVNIYDRFCFIQTIVKKDNNYPDYYEDMEIPIVEDMDLAY